MANFSDFNGITNWNGELWIYNIPGNYSGTPEGDIEGAAVGDTFTILPKHGGYPYVLGTGENQSEDVRWRPGTYEIIAVANGYGTPDGGRNMVRLNSVPLEDRSGNQVGHFNNPYMTDKAIGYLNNPSQVPLVAGTLSFGSRNGTTVTLTEAGSSGGTGFGKKLHRTTSPTDAIDSSTVVATSAGPWTDTPPTDALYYYFVEYFDNANAPKTSNICAASRNGTNAPAMPVAKTGAPPKLGITAIGDSNVEYGAFNATPTLLEGIDARHDVAYTNKGVGGTRALMWVNNAELYQPALDAIAAHIAAGRVPIIIQMLGSNESVLDSRPAADYGTDVQNLVQKWLTAGAQYVFLVQPGYSIPRKFNISVNGLLALMLQYHAQLASIAAGDPKIIYVPGLYRYLADHQDLIGDGIHFGGGTDIAARYATIAVANTIPATAVPGDGLTEEQVRDACLAALASIGIDAEFAELVAAIKAKTDNLPQNPAAVEDVQGGTGGGYKLVRGPLQVVDAEQQLLDRCDYVVGDREPSLLVQFLDENKAPLDLTGSTVQFVMDRGTQAGIVGNCVIESGTLGYARYDWAAGDLAAAGTFTAWFRRTAGAKRSTMGRIAIVVRPDVATGSGGG